MVGPVPTDLEKLERLITFLPFNLVEDEAWAPNLAELEAVVTPATRPLASSSLKSLRKVTAVPSRLIFELVLSRNFVW